MAVELPVVNEKVDRLRDDFDSHVDKNDRAHDNMFAKLDAIWKDYSSRLPNWATHYIAMLTWLVGVMMALTTALLLKVFMH